MSALQGAAYRTGMTALWAAVDNGDETPTGNLLRGIVAHVITYADETGIVCAAHEAGAA